MAFHRRLSDHQMIAARWEYEVTPISERSLAAKYGLSRSAIHDWIVKQGWTRAEVLRSYEGEAGQREFQRDVRAAIKAAGDKKIIQALERTLVLPPAGKVTKVATPGQPGVPDVEGAWELPPDQPQSSQNASFPGSFGKRKTGEQGGQVIPFRGPNLPPPSPSQMNPAIALPSRSRTEQAATRVHLASLRGELVLQQLQQLQLHDELLWDYHHLLSVFMNPSKLVDVAGLDPEQASAKLEAISRQAGRLVLPTERDTLAGAIVALNKAMIASFAAQRAAAGITPRQMNGRGAQRDEDEHEAPQDLNTLDVTSLRTVQRAMALLTGNLQRSNEPPRPPPPETLDDLLVRRDETSSDV